MKKAVMFSAVLLMTLLAQAKASAHFGMIIPSATMIMQGEPKRVNLNLSFSHPFAGTGMALIKPQVIRVVNDGNILDLLDRASKSIVMGHTGWKIEYKINRPGFNIMGIAQICTYQKGF
jgi:cobalt/nickel transport protein